MAARFEDALSLVGGFGRWQWAILLAASYEAFFVTQQNMGLIFLGGIPPHWCRGDEAGRNHSMSTKESLCRWTNTTDECQEWDYDHSVFDSTVVTEWNLVCSRRPLLAVLQSSYMFGLLLGSIIFGAISDKFGRRTACLAASVLEMTFALASAFAPNYYVFLILRIFNGAGVAGIHTCNYVLVTEIVPAERRAVAAMAYNMPHALGHMCFAGWAYFIRDWHMLQMAMALPMTLMLSYWLYLPDSPRWLLSRGRTADATKVLSLAARCNKACSEDIQDLPQVMEKLTAIATKMPPKRKGSCPGVCARFNVLIRTPEMRRRSTRLFFCWFIASMVYYGIAFSATRLRVSPFLVVLITGFNSLISRIVAYLPQEYLGRRLTYALCHLVAGTAVLSSMLVQVDDHITQVALSLTCNFANAMAFCTGYLYTAELFPTQTRNVAVGFGSTCARAGAMVAPFVLDILGRYSKFIPPATFGSLAVVAAGVCLLLPETKNQRLPDTVQDVENMVALKNIKIGKNGVGRDEVDS